MPETIIGAVPDDWRLTTLGDLCRSGGGGIQTGPFGSQLHASDYVPVGIPSVMPQNIGDNVLVEDGIARISSDDAQRLSRYLLRKGDIVYSRRGDVGRRALVRGHQDGWLCGTGCLRVRLAGSADPKFVSYYLGHPEVRSWIVRHAVGATMPNLNTEILSSVPVVVPPANLQRVVGEVLGALDDKIAVNERIARTWEELLTAKFEDLAIDTDSMAAEKVAVTEMVEFNPPVPVPKGESVYLDMASVPTGTARVHQWTRREPKSGSRFCNGDTVMARITPCLENGKTAFIDFLAPGEIGVGSTEFIVLRARAGVPTHLPYFLARSPRFRGHAIQNMVGSSGRQRVGVDALIGYTVNRANLEAVAAFGQEAEAAFAHMKSLGAESHTLRELRDALLPGLMSGAIRIRDAEKLVEDAA
ncbi:restriction endonuclease subunit S [Micromonospora globbae]|uniref:restriction endonuclease subunit S n=1 Tax=Micromonospora globbae TaxID=1894969 RepID=UPI003864C8C4|nr:restriction endonuclease subunit S [Micromonospora globbae]